MIGINGWKTSGITLDYGWFNWMAFIFFWNASDFFFILDYCLDFPENVTCSPDFCDRLSVFFCLDFLLFLSC